MLVHNSITPLRLHLGGVFQSYSQADTSVVPIGLLVTNRSIANGIMNAVKKTINESVTMSPVTGIKPVIKAKTAPPIPVINDMITPIWSTPLTRNIPILYPSICQTWRKAPAMAAIINTYIVAIMFSIPPIMFFSNVQDCKQVQ